MIQLYPVCLLVLASSALLSFIEVFRTELSFLLRFKLALRKNEKVRTMLFVAIIAISILMLLLPIYPGPMVLGDLLPSLTLFYAAFFIRKIDDSSDDVDANGKLESSVSFKKGLFFSLVFTLHFLFPSFIIL